MKTDWTIVILLCTCAAVALCLLLGLAQYTSGVAKQAAEVTLVQAQAAKASAEAEKAHQEAETIRLTREKEMQGWTLVNLEEKTGAFANLGLCAVLPLCAIAFLFFLGRVGGRGDAE